MPQPPILKINDIFSSLQGEGLRQGSPTLFVRLAGCNLRCRYCDTPEAWINGRDMTPDRIMRTLRSLHKRFPAEWVCLTGGEPLLQDIRYLITSLKKENFKIQVETNAIQAPCPGVDWYTISPKPRSYSFHPAFTTRAKEVKLVVTENLTFTALQSLRNAFPSRTPLILQPQSNLEWSFQKGMRLMKKSLKARLKNIRLSIQMHKIYGLK